MHNSISTGAFSRNPQQEMARTAALGSSLSRNESTNSLDSFVSAASSLQSVASHVSLPSQSDAHQPNKMNAPTADQTIDLKFIKEKMPIQVYRKILRHLALEDPQTLSKPVSKQMMRDGAGIIQEIADENHMQLIHGYQLIKGDKPTQPFQICIRQIAFNTGQAEIPAVPYQIIVAGASAESKDLKYYPSIPQAFSRGANEAIEEIMMTSLPKNTNGMATSLAQNCGIELEPAPIRLAESQLVSQTNTAAKRMANALPYALVVASLSVIYGVAGNATLAKIYDEGTLESYLSQNLLLATARGATMFSAALLLKVMHAKLATPLNNLVDKAHALVLQPSQNYMRQAQLEGNLTQVVATNQLWQQSVDNGYTSHIEP